MHIARYLAIVKTLASIAFVIVAFYLLYSVLNQRNTTFLSSCDEYSNALQQRHFPFGLPEGTPATNILLEREIYVLSFNIVRKLVDWVGYCLDANRVGTNTREHATYYPRDPDIPDEFEIEDADYAGAYNALGVQKAHLVPSRSFSGSTNWDMLNYISNIVPQNGALNGGKWRAIEEVERSLLKKSGVVFVVSGSLHEALMPSLPNANPENDKIRIPSGFFKIIIIGNPQVPESIRATAFIFGQVNPDKVETQIVTIDDLETRSGFDFLPDLSDSIETMLESTLGEWPIN